MYQLCGYLSTFFFVVISYNILLKPICREIENWNTSVFSTVTTRIILKQTEKSSHFSGYVTSAPFQSSTFHLHGYCKVFSRQSMEQTKLSLYILLDFSQVDRTSNHCSFENQVCSDKTEEKPFWITQMM